MISAGTAGDLCAAGTAIAQFSAAVRYRHGQRERRQHRHSRTQNLVCHNHPTNDASSHALQRKQPGGQEPGKQAGQRLRTTGHLALPPRTQLSCTLVHASPPPQPTPPTDHTRLPAVAGDDVRVGFGHQGVGAMQVQQVCKRGQAGRQAGRQAALERGLVARRQGHGSGFRPPRC